MTEISTKVETSLEARPAALFVQTATKFKSGVTVNIDNKTANGKSIMGMISLEILDGQTVTLRADGEDEKEALDELKKFFIEQQPVSN